MRRGIKLVLSYDGTDYCGWQIQPNGVTVQAVLSEAVRRVTGEMVLPAAAGRTDSGVHALGQVVHFVTETDLPADTLRRALNANLPATVVVREAADCSPEFDPVRNSTGKVYRYLVHDGIVPNVFMLRYAWQTRTRLDERAMNEGARFLVGRHDFRAFESHWPNRASSVRTVRHCAWCRLGDILVLDVEADGFLYNMVRAIAGTLVQVGKGRHRPEWVGEVLEGGARSAAGPTAPPQGLFLVRVDYGPVGKDPGSIPKFPLRTALGATDATGATGATG